MRKALSGSSPELNLADLRATAAAVKKPELVKNLTSEGTASIKDGALNYRGNLSSPGERSLPTVASSEKSVLGPSP
jgi:hypothetical protein